MRAKNSFLALGELGPKSRALGSWGRVISAPALRERETSGTQDSQNLGATGHRFRKKICTDLVHKCSSRSNEKWKWTGKLKNLCREDALWAAFWIILWIIISKRTTMGPVRPSKTHRCALFTRRAFTRNMCRDMFRGMGAGPTGGTPGTGGALKLRVSPENRFDSDEFCRVNYTKGRIYTSRTNLISYAYHFFTTRCHETPPKPLCASWRNSVSFHRARLAFHNRVYMQWLTFQTAGRAIPTWRRILRPWKSSRNLSSSLLACLNLSRCSFSSRCFDLSLSARAFSRSCWRKNRLFQNLSSLHGK